MRELTAEDQITGMEGIGTNVLFVKTLRSAVTTAWGVDWDEVYIARDIMQNFFDANRGSLTQIHVEVVGKEVRITAPNPFNLERLFYLGSEKGDDDVGQYGEGFKVAATCLLRDHSVDVVAASGHDLLRLRISHEAVRDTDIYPVEYDFYKSESEVPGTLLLLRGCSSKLAKALVQGLNHFFHEGNALLGAKLWESHRCEFSIYESTDGTGHVFYRKLKRGEIEDIPLVLVIDKRYDAIEKKIGKDRDRNAFGEEVMRTFFNHFARFGAKSSLEGVWLVVEKARDCWVKGHPLLSAIADAVGYADWPKATGIKLFGDGFYARSTSRQSAEQLQFNALESSWREQGKACLPQYFHKFGCLNARRHFLDLQAKALEEAKRGNQRPPTRNEEEGIQILSRVTKDLAPNVMALFEEAHTSYQVALTEAILGQLKNGRSYRSREVFLGAAVFQMDFAEALAVFLHEHAHIFGDDGHRGFTDALTHMIEAVVRYRQAMNEYEEEWELVRMRIAQERQTKIDSAVEPEPEWFAGKSREELRELLRRVPAVVLRQLEKEEGNSEQSRTANSFEM